MAAGEIWGDATVGDIKFRDSTDTLRTCLRSAASSGSKQDNSLEVSGSELRFHWSGSTFYRRFAGVSAGTPSDPSGSIYISGQYIYFVSGATLYRVPNA